MWPSIMQIFTGKTAVVTGGNRGIGLAIARELGTRGCRVVICGRDANALESAVTELKNDGCAISAKGCDISNPAQVDAFFQAVRDHFGTLDFLINNAGAAHALAHVEQFAPEEFCRVVDVNLIGTFLCCRSAIPLLRAGGVMVNNLSVAALQTFVGMSAYNASKAGALALTNVLREELREKGIRVLALVPGAVDTEIWQQFWPEAPREKMVSAADVARAVVLALTMPANTSIDEIRLGPASGVL
ncbi:MAG: SDR family NAD(P)-dependent oxidoreductase [Acidobacteria bacterium]|nr:SDR family NAD(P)-dependent oxidoreductase [Acidobacteriota bacterium]